MRHTAKLVHLGIRVEDWYLTECENDKEILEEFCEAFFKPSGEDEGPFAYFPVEWFPHDGWRDDPIADPATLRLVMGVDHDVVIEVNLNECLSGTIEDCEIDGSFVLGLEMLGAAFVSLAQRIDVVVQKARADGNYQRKVIRKQKIEEEKKK